MALQALIEGLTSEAFTNNTSGEVLGPVGASAATFEITPEWPIEHGLFEIGKRVERGFRRHPESTAAGLWATAPDLAKVLQTVLDSLHGKRRAILPLDLATRMAALQNRKSGLGVFIVPNRIIRHERRNHGFDAVMAAEFATGRIRTAAANR